MIRIIRLLGAALGAFIGLGLATASGLFLETGSSIRPDPGRLDRRLVDRGLRDPAVPDDRPGNLDRAQRPGPLDRRVRHRRGRADHRPADGPPARGSAVELPRSAGPLAAAGDLDRLRPGDGRADGGQAPGPDRGGRGDRHLPAAGGGRGAAGPQGRPAHHRRHERDHRRPDRRDRRVGLHLRHAGHPALRARGAPAHRRQLGHAPPQSRPARPRDPGQDAEGFADAGRDRRGRGPRRRPRSMPSSSPSPSATAGRS